MAPCLMASIAVSMLACPVIRMTWQSGSAVRIRLNTSRPSTSGMRKSTRATAAFWSPSFSSASWPLPAVATSKLRCGRQNVRSGGECRARHRPRAAWGARSRQLFRWSLRAPRVNQRRRRLAGPVSHVRALARQTRGIAPPGGGSLTIAQKAPSCRTASMNALKSTGFTT